MFKNMDEVIRRWAERYRSVDLYFNKMPAVGFSKSDLALLEHEFQMKLDSTFVSVVQKANLDNVSFNGLAFGAGRPYLEVLMNCNPAGKWSNSQDEKGYLIVGHTSIFAIVMNNNTGEIFAMHDDERPAKTKIAENFERLICIAATLGEYNHMNFENKKHAEDFFTRLLEQESIKQGQQFWIMVGRHAA